MSALVYNDDDVYLPLMFILMSILPSSRRTQNNNDSDDDDGRGSYFVVVHRVTIEMFLPFSCPSFVSQISIPIFLSTCIHLPHRFLSSMCYMNEMRMMWCLFSHNYHSCEIWNSGVELVWPFPVCVNVSSFSMSTIWNWHDWFDVMMWWWEWKSENVMTFYSFYLVVVLPIPVYYVMIMMVWWCLSTYLKMFVFLYLMDECVTYSLTLFIPFLLPFR